MLSSLRCLSSYLSLLQTHQFSLAQWAYKGFAYDQHWVIISGLQHMPVVEDTAGAGDGAFTANSEDTLERGIELFFKKVPKDTIRKQFTAKPKTKKLKNAK